MTVRQPPASRTAMQQTPSRLVPPLSADIARLRRAVPLLCVVLSFGIGSLRCLAQDMRLQLPASVTAADIRGILDTEGDNLPSGVRKALRARLAELEGGTAAKAEGPDEGAKEDGPALPPEAKAVLGALDSLRSMERPAVLYGAHAAVQRADPTNAPAARLVWAVARHDWPVVGEVLRGLPTDVAPRAYARLLQSLARHVGPPPRGRDTSARHGISNRGRGLDPFALVEKDDDEPGETSDAWGDLTGPGAAFTPQDLDAILTLAPAPFDTTNAVIASVAAIAADAYRGKDASEALRARIRAGGLPGFVGGEAGRGLRSELLLHLGWHDPDALAAASAPDASVEDLLRAAHHACLATEDSPEALDSGVAALLRTLDAKPPVPLPELRGATERLLECLGTNGVALAAAVFDKRPDLGDVLLSGRMPAADGEGPKDDDEGDDEDDDPSHDLEARRSALTRQRVLGLALCRSGDPARRTLAAGPVCVWLAEVGFSLPKLVERLGERDRDRYYRSSSDPEPLERGALLAGAPAPDVVARLSEPLRRRARLTRFSVELLSYEEGQLAALRELAADYPDAAASMADTLLSSWARTKAPASIDPDELERMRYYAMMQRGYRSRTPTREGFPLTRGRQLRNLSELRALVSELRRIAGDRLDAKGVVAAFAASHSLAEVFTAEDIEAVFGARGEISRSVLADLVETMRTNLNEGWRKLDASAQSSAGRTSDEVAQEVLRGYGLAAALADEATSRPDAGWRDWDLRGKLYHDAAEFAYDQRAPLSEYTALRDAAFGSLRGAIAAYAAAEPSADDAPALRSSITPYMTWLTITLGASDGSLLTRTRRATRPGSPRSQGIWRRCRPDGPDRSAVCWQAWCGASPPRRRGTPASACSKGPPPCWVPTRPKPPRSPGSWRTTAASCASASSVCGSMVPRPWGTSRPSRRTCCSATRASWDARARRLFRCCRPIRNDARRWRPIFAPRWSHRSRSSRCSSTSPTSGRSTCRAPTGRRPRCCTLRCARAGRPWTACHRSRRSSTSGTSSTASSCRSPRRSSRSTPRPTRPRSGLARTWTRRRPSTCATGAPIGRCWT